MFEFNNELDDGRLGGRFRRRVTAGARCNSGSVDGEVLVVVGGLVHLLVLVHNTLKQGLVAPKNIVRHPFHFLEDFDEKGRRCLPMTVLWNGVPRTFRNVGLLGRCFILGYSLPNMA
ncbi:hypothetical protein BKA70DRAFT_1242277 [Coprinopsis sp. MPI-PUGE-AT-0042]|nr:hypothetical protein BKA70DRAFT_1242277 [Coprinopsis sp. MPI-PUGE-AT-0042]